MEKDKKFKIDKSKDISSDLFHYIQSNLYDEEIILSDKNDNTIVFKWKFEPQTAGTETQKLAYQTMKITEVVNFLLKKVDEKFGESK